jgi:hypothetical protein
VYPVKKKKKTIIIVSISTLLVGCLTLGVFYSLMPRVSITFHTSNQLSYPNHTVWFIAEARTDDVVNFSIKTNDVIQNEVTTWKINDTTSLYMDKTIKMRLYASSSSLSKKIALKDIQVINWTTSINSEITNIRNHFVNYLEVNTSLQNINHSSDWWFCGTAPQILIVEHYLFRSEFWEMEISRHVMIPPHDWVQVYLRPRNYSTPTWAGKIDSWSLDNTSIRLIEPPDTPFR